MGRMFLPTLPRTINHVAVSTSARTIGHGALSLPSFFVFLESFSKSSSYSPLKATQIRKILPLARLVRVLRALGNIEPPWCGRLWR